MPFWDLGLGLPEGMLAPMTAQVGTLRGQWGQGHTHTPACLHAANSAGWVTQT